MSNKRFKDFDAFWAEKENIPLTVKVFGKEHQLPAALPASLVLQLVRAQASGVKDVPPTMVLEMADSLFGEVALTEWQSKGMTIDQLGDLIKWAVDSYNGTEEETDPT